MNIELSTDVVADAVRRVIAEQSTGLLDNFNVAKIEAICGGQAQGIDAISVSLAPKLEPRIITEVTAVTPTGVTLRLAADFGQNLLS